MWKRIFYCEDHDRCICHSNDQDASSLPECFGGGATLGLGFLGFVSSRSSRRCGATMARGGSLIHRVLQYVVNELLVERLANSITFQRFAVRSSKKIEDLAQKGAEKKEELAEQWRSLSSGLRDEMSRNFKDPKRGF